MNHTNTVHQTSNSANTNTVHTKICFTDLCAYTWIASSLGLPLIVSAYINKLASTVNMECLGESGTVLYNGSHLSKLDIDSLSLGQKAFVDDVSLSGSLPWILFIGPFSIPMSLFCGVKSTINYFRFRLSKNKINPQPQT
jgi:hypothetical protein